ncbi:MAG TPA: glycosyltransferase [Gemmatimonadales bacterium]|nr:glycosyltransferase [Gemmatimonadales bacterium]
MRAAILCTQYADPGHRGKLRALTGLGVHVAALVPERWTPPFAARPIATSHGTDGGVEVMPVPTRSTGLETRWDLRKVRRVLTEQRPDVLQLEAEPWTEAAADIVALARRLSIPVVLVTLDALPRRLGWRAARRRRRVLRAVQGVIAGTALAAELVTELRPEVPLTILPQLGVQPAAEPQPLLRGDDFVIGFIGRLVPERGLDLLLRAAARLPGPWSIVVAGSGPAQEPLEELAERLGIAGRVTWRGALRRAELAEVWPELDCLVLPARTTPDWVETSPQAVVEALGRGVPVVVSASGALPETVGPGGFVVPEENATALTDTLLLLRDSPDEAGRRAAIGRQRVLAHFAHDAVARQTLEFWGRIRATP